MKNNVNGSMFVNYQSETEHVIIGDVARVTAVVSASIFLIGLLLVMPAQCATKTAKPASKVLTVLEMIKQLTPSEKAQVLAAIAPEDKSKPAVKTPIVTQPKEEPFTSLIIDATGLGIDRCMSPKVFKADGSEVWGTLTVTPEFVIDTGLASFVSSMDEAQKCKRCGSKPLIVKAAAVSTVSTLKYPVVSDTDAALIHNENAKSKFADNCNVVFIIGQ